MACCNPNSPSDAAYIFKPDYKAETITGKFYSRYEQMPKIKTPEILKHEAGIDEMRNVDVRCKMIIPRYSNQTYGWLPGYKIRFLQSCSDYKIYNHSIMENMVKEMFTRRLIEPLSKYHECSCQRHQRRRACRI